jgi:hypothetical protein
MKIKAQVTEVRKIAQGIFDHKERRVVLKMVAEYERLARLKAAA